MLPQRSGNEHASGHMRFLRMSGADRAERVVQGRVAQGRVAQALRLAPLASVLALGGCAMAVDAPMVFGDSGKYQYHNCEQLTAAATGQAARERELKDLIDKADQGAGGFIVSLMAYKTDYLAVEEDLRVIQSTMRNKNCPAPANWQSNGAVR
jgi:hypothetical protein